MDERKQKDDQLLAVALAELDAFEERTGIAVEVPAHVSTAAGNCAPGVVEWRAKHAGGREVIPARELLTIAAECRDQISRVVLGVRRAIKLAGG